MLKIFIYLIIVLTDGSESEGSNLTEKKKPQGPPVNTTTYTVIIATSIYFFSVFTKIPTVTAKK